MIDAMTDRRATDSPATSTTPEVSFSAALAELEAILRRIEAETVDLDELAGELARAAGLLEICRGKVRKAEVEVQEILTRFSADSEPTDRSSAAAVRPPQPSR